MSAVPKPQKQTRTKVLPPCRVSEFEHVVIKKRARESGLSLSEFQRRACLDGCIVTPMPVANFELIRALNRIGVNLNQRQRKLNATGQDSPAEMRVILNKIESLLDTLL